MEKRNDHVQGENFSRSGEGTVDVTGITRDALLNIGAAGAGEDAPGRAARLVVLVDITAAGAPSGMQPADALTFIAARLHASAEAHVAAFNASQGRKRAGLQLSVSLTRALGGSHRAPAFEFESVRPDEPGDDIESDPAALASVELTQSGYLAAIRASRALGGRR